MSHSRYAPSSSGRWLNCTASLKIAENYPKSSSVFSVEGEAAHDVAAKVLTEGRKAAQFLGTKYTRDGYMCEVSLDMVKHVDRYVEFVSTLGTDIGYIEQKVFFDDYGVPGGYGTVDYLTFEEDQEKAILVDLKYGKGVPVTAENNTQLRMYALGVLQQFDGLYPIKQVETHIFQPRLDSHTQVIYSVKELTQWANTVVKPAVRQIETGKVQFGVGDWCTKHFCPARHECAARAAVLNQAIKEELPQLDSENTDVLSGEDIAKVLKQVSKVRSYLSDVESAAYARLQVDPDAVPGWKLVEGRSNRIWRDTMQIEQALRKKRVKVRDMFQMKMKSPAQIEKTLADKAWSKELVSQHAHKPQGKPSLVEASDRREPYRLRAETEFNVLDNKENQNGK